MEQSEIKETGEAENQTPDSKAKELSKEEQERLEKERLREERLMKMAVRQEIITNWAKQRTNFIAIILLFFFMLVIIISYIFRPQMPMLQPAQSNNANVKREGQKK